MGFIILRVRIVSQPKVLTGLNVRPVTSFYILEVDVDNLFGYRDFEEHNNTIVLIYTDIVSRIIIQPYSSMRLLILKC